MVGRLDLCEEQTMSCGVERGLDSPDSGLPPSPCPGAWLPVCAADKARGESPVSEDEGRGCTVPATVLHLQPSCYGEGICLDPLPPKEIRYTSSVRYDSERRFIQSVTLQPRGQGLERCSQTITALSHSTWRRYKTQLDFEPRQRVDGFRSTTIVYPKTSSCVFATELSYDRQRRARRFLSSVQLQAAAGGQLPR
ncbi:refilin B [Synchiropus splendidus]|uniref:refilin B n=1 Tax=Synchiropus splendidus TaxID=270530 RepID=UPI00237DA44A|nr:refilin B [Synchiropus splendidus]